MVFTLLRSAQCPCSPAPTASESKGGKELAVQPSSRTCCESHTPHVASHMHLRSQGTGNTRKRGALEGGTPAFSSQVYPGPGGMRLPTRRPPLSVDTARKKWLLSCIRAPSKEAIVTRRGRSRQLEAQVPTKASGSWKRPPTSI